MSDGPTMPPSDHEQARRHYDRHGFVHLTGLIPQELAIFLARYVLLSERLGRFAEDNAQVPGSSVGYGDPAFETLLEVVGPSVGDLLGLRLAPTYSFIRLYKEGQALEPHRDRPACEHSVTLHLGGDGDEWPLFLQLGDDEPASWTQGIGDATVYRGCDVLHWRRPFSGMWYAQVFLHFVDMDGEHRGELLDGREAIGMPSNRSERLADSRPAVGP